MANDKNNNFDVSAITSDSPLSNEQQAWLGGYFAGLETASSIGGGGENSGGSNTHILFASQTGNAEGVAHDLGSAIGGTVLDMADVSADDLKGFENVVVVTSTYGDGEHPDNGQILWDGVQDIDKLSFNYAVLGLGDTAYDFFCKSAEDWDSFFEGKGATRKIDTLKLDVDFEEQAELWIGKVKGVFGGTTGGSASGGANNTKVLFGSQTGNAEGVAFDLASALGTTAIDMADVSADDFKAFENVVIVTSTYGDGEHPDNGQILWDTVQGVDKVSCNYVVLGLGDTAYDFFCKSATDWDEFLQSKGGTRKIDTLKLDVDFEDEAEKWAEKAKGIFAELGGGSSGGSAEKPAKSSGGGHKSIYTKNNPYMGEFLTNTLLSKDGSDKQVHHFEFEVNDPEMAYEAGDALGVIPFNSEKLVNGVIEAGGFDGSTQVGDKTLTEILTETLEIRNPNKDFINAVAEKSGDKKLADMIADKKAMDDYLWGREVIDFLNDYKVEFTELEFVGLMKPLQHRLYSISSSPKAHPGEVHLTVAAVKYDFNDRPCEGVASCFLADYLPTGEKVGLFMHGNKAFSIPEDNSVPMIMVGPGTGIAPFRAFMEERLAIGADGQNWLFFGDRTKHDYLYQDTLESWEKDGKIKLSLAWSREKDVEKTYVQDLMRAEGKELFEALEQGGYFFVCGDASRMAKDVEAALLEVIATNGAMSVEKATDYLNNLKKSKRYVRDVY